MDCKRFVPKDIWPKGSCGIDYVTPNYKPCLGSLDCCSIPYSPEAMISMSEQIADDVLVVIAGHMHGEEGGQCASRVGEFLKGYVDSKSDYFGFSSEVRRFLNSTINHVPKRSAFLKELGDTIDAWAPKLETFSKADEKFRNDYALIFRYMDDVLGIIPESKRGYAAKEMKSLLKRRGLPEKINDALPAAYVIEIERIAKEAVPHSLGRREAASNELSRFLRDSSVFGDFEARRRHKGIL